MSVRLMQGDCREVLKTLPDCSVQMVCTSPPYYALRDYGTATWDGGDAGCDHIQTLNLKRDASGGLGGGRDLGTRGVQPSTSSSAIGYRDTCGKCGARRVDRQIGLESSVEDYVSELVAVFRELRRVLRDDGVLFLNLGDSYCNAGSSRNGEGLDGARRGGATGADGALGYKRRDLRHSMNGIKHKDLIGVPWRVAFALQADGWWLRSEITWVKRAPMPESVRDRPTSATEKVFMLTKSARYFYDAEAVKEENSSPEQLTHNLKYAKPYAAYDDRAGDTGQPGNINNVGIHSRPGTNGRNMRNYVILSPDPFPGAHFAVMPKDLVEICIKAGTSEKGACPACGAPWWRVTERESMEIMRSNRGLEIGQEFGRTQASGTMTRAPSSRTLGWEPTCACDAGDPVPCVTLDPFGGAGTVSLVSERLARDSIYIDLSPEYLSMTRRRIYNDAPLFTVLT